MADAAIPVVFPIPPPPEWKMVPLPPTPMTPCATAVIIPKQSRPMPGRADAVDRWDACKCKNPVVKSPTYESSSGQKNSSPGRGSSSERWDINKKSATSCRRTDIKKQSTESCERWDINKSATSPSSRSSRSCGPASSTARSRWHFGSKKRPVSRSSSSSDERWDAHKKPRPLPRRRTDLLDDDGDSSSTGTKDVPQTKIFYAGPSFLTPPEPTMLPMPSFLVLPRFIAA